MNTEKKEFNRDQRKFEFTIYLNDNIIVQRFFNVVGFNKAAINSMNFKESVDYCVSVIQNHLKNKSLDYMNSNSKYFYENPMFDQNNMDDLIKIVIKLDGKQIAYREWRARIYPAKIRYTIDVRQHIYDMITTIQKCLSERSESLETSYMDYSLAV